MNEDEAGWMPFGTAVATGRLLRGVAIEDVVLALSKHWLGMNGDGSKVMIVPGLPAISRHAGINGCPFVVMTTASAEDTIAMLSDEL
jgi:hypothetical protein